MADFYQTLGVAKTASQDEVKKAFRGKARDCHPDRNPGDASAEERFKEVNQAYETLSDPKKRAQYDELSRLGAFGPGAGGFRPGAGGSQGFDPRIFQQWQQQQGAGGATFEFGDMGDVLSSLFGAASTGRGRRRRAAAERGADLQADVTVSFKDSLEGVTARVPVDKSDTCDGCHGTGAAAGTTAKICPDCQGRGVVAQNQGPFALSQPCQRCRGAGTIVETPCPTCKGSGVRRRTRRYSVKIPAGVRDGTRIRIKGKGEAGQRGGPTGDLYVAVHVEPDDLFERRGDDLVIEVPVTLSEAALGARVKIPTSGGGKISLKVPPGSRDGRTLRLRGKGAPRLKGGGHGDLLARVRIAVPDKLSKEQKELLEQLGGMLPDPRATAFG